MAKVSRSERVTRMLAFLRAAQKKKVAAALAAHGFSQAELDLGWSLFGTAVGNVFKITPATPLIPGELTELDKWENKWFPIISASLSANFPAVHERVFLNLNQTEGEWLIPSVSLLLERIAALTSDEATDEDKAAAQLLVKRGLTAEVIKEASTLIENLQIIDEEDPDDKADAAKGAKQAAEDAMWNYYKEWSAIARASIKSKKLLKALGFMKETQKKESEPTKPKKDDVS